MPKIPPPDAQPDDPSEEMAPGQRMPRKYFAEKAREYRKRDGWLTPVQKAIGDRTLDAYTPEEAALVERIREAREAMETLQQELQDRMRNRHLVLSADPSLTPAQRKRVQTVLETLDRTRLTMIQIAH